MLELSDRVAAQNLAVQQKPVVSGRYSSAIWEYQMRHMSPVCECAPP